MSRILIGVTMSRWPVPLFCCPQRGMQPRRAAPRTNDLGSPTAVWIIAVTRSCDKVRLVLYGPS